MNICFNFRGKITQFLIFLELGITEMMNHNNFGVILLNCILLIILYKVSFKSLTEEDFLCFDFSTLWILTSLKD